MLRHRCSPIVMTPSNRTPTHYNVRGQLSWPRSLQCVLTRGSTPRLLPPLQCPSSTTIPIPSRLVIARPSSLTAITMPISSNHSHPFLRAPHPSSPLQWSSLATIPIPSASRPITAHRSPSLPLQCPSLLVTALVPHPIIMPMSTDHSNPFRFSHGIAPFPSLAALIMPCRLILSNPVPLSRSRHLHLLHYSAIWPFKLFLLDPLTTTLMYT
jgi:hypothetical protein